jgi:predicted Zn-dependent protease
MTLTQFLVTALLGASLLAGSAAGTPLQMTVSTEVKKGEEMHQEMMKQGARYPDDQLQAYVDRVGQALASNSSRPTLKWTFTVVDSESINAFALPGGYIYINRGLLVYLDSEAELAGVLGHEIGHVTARHASRQQSGQVTKSVLSQLTYILTGSGDLAQASDLYGTTLLRGYGREHELEADREGAQFMHNTGYDPYSLLEVIGVLKDQEEVSRAKAKAQGKLPQTYHGVFSTHPRNDQRLQEVVQAAGKLEDLQLVETDPVYFRQALNGLTWGKGSTTSDREEDRFYHNKLKFTFREPENWTVDAGRKAIVAHDTASDGKISLTIKKKNSSGTASEFLGQQLAATTLQETAELEQAGLKGYTGIAPPANGLNQRRVAVVYYGKLAYLFEGVVVDNASFESYDTNFMAVIESFRPMHKNERKAKDGKKIVYIQADDDTTFAVLARASKVRDAEVQLRLMNGYYPRGEPRIGEWIKTIQ